MFVCKQVFVMVNFWNRAVSYHQYTLDVGKDQTKTSYLLSLKEITILLTAAL